MKNLITTIIIFLLCGVYSSAYASSVTYQKVKIGSIAAHAAVVNLADPEVKVSIALARGGRGSSESFKSLVRRTQPAVAITGTFFDTRTLIPTGDIAVFGTLVHSGCIGSALCISPSNEAEIVPLRTGRECMWLGYETVLCAGPTIIADGKIAINLKSEGFRNSLYHSARRTGVGITKSGKLVILAINKNVSLYHLAKALLKLNVKSALCLDGGSSTGFYCTGRYWAVPSRTLTNLLVVYTKSDKYYKSKTALVSKKLFDKGAMQTEKRVIAQASLFSRPTQPSESSVISSLSWNFTPQIYASQN